jgi:hypothetical protein
MESVHNLSEEQQASLLNTCKTIRNLIGCSWVSCLEGRGLCDILGLTSVLKQLLDYGGKSQDHSYEQDQESEVEFIPVHIDENIVLIRKMDLRIKASHILRVVGKTKHLLTRFRKEHKGQFDIVRGLAQHQGTYVDFPIGLQLCKKYYLDELGTLLWETLRRYPL